MKTKLESTSKEKEFKPFTISILASLIFGDQRYGDKFKTCSSSLISTYLYSDIQIEIENQGFEI